MIPENFRSIGPSVLELSSGMRKKKKEEKEKKFCQNHKAFRHGAGMLNSVYFDSLFACSEFSIFVFMCVH